MAKKKTSWLPKFEVLIILVFFMSFIIWAVSQCNETKSLYQDEPEAETTSTSDAETNIPDSLSLSLTNANSATNNNTTTTQPITAPPPIRQNNFAPLFVTIDGLNMRTGPSLDSAVVVKLKLFEQVNFMGEVTDSTEQINLGYEIADEPWVKVQHKRGKVGWVYGAGVHYHKKKRGGVIPN